MQRKDASTATLSTSGSSHFGVPSAVRDTALLPGQPLDAGTRTDMESHLGEDLGDVRVHADARAGHAARSIGARAYTIGNHIVFGEHEFRPGEAGGRRLIAHELVHVVQQRGASGGTGLVQRQPGPSDAQRTANESAQRADSAAGNAGPCGVEARALSNQGLLLQLNRARVYLSQHTWGEDQTYDYNNLLVRLSAERRRRIEGGHVWLAGRGLIRPPDELYSLEPGDGLTLTVRNVPGSTAAGGFLWSSSTVVTRSQFERFLARHDLPTVEMGRIFDSVFGARDPNAARSTSVSLPASTRTGTLPSPLPDPLAMFPFGSPTAATDPFSPLGGGSLGIGRVLPSAFWMPFGPPPSSAFGNLMGAPPGASPLLGRRSTFAYTPSSAELVNDARNAPGAITSSGPERLFMPARRAPAPAQVLLVDASGNVLQPLGLVDANQMGGASSGGPTGLSSLGFLSRPPPLAPGTSGIMWEGSHVSQISMVGDRMLTMGFRAPFYMHAIDSLTGHRSGATSNLNVGTPGLYANDALFPAAGELWGRGPLAPSHWKRGSVAIVRADGTPLDAAELMRVMVEAQSALAGQEYRFSPPPAGSAAERAADATARERGRSGFDRTRGAQMCINPPCISLNELALGQPLTFTRPDGTVVNLSNPDQATARAMSEFMSQPDAFWEARGLRRVNLGARVWGSYAGAGGIGVGLSVISDAYRAAEGERPAWLRDAAISGGSNVVSAAAEDFTYTALVPRIARVAPGLGASGVSTASRFAAGTGVALVIAPLTTAAQMYLSDEQFTTIDYEARMTRSAVSATGGALATIGTAALLGSSAGPVGTVVGIIVGIGAYALTDAMVGDITEESMREALGERGCTGGVGPGR
ncbi:eCIS core domain-containing protein [Sorangium sp. So ce1389]|uniref:eCIS core domain-containing protein n=1 Tax=Sorangium sp. So ce1389 TaxID=3133336 RepID=UPI003F6423BA